MVTRYEDVGTCGGSCHDMIPCRDGSWVDYDDYKELLDKYEKICKMVTDVWREVD